MSAARPIGVGAVGLGRAFSLMAPTFARHPGTRLTTAFDPREEARARFTRDFGARASDSFEALCTDPEVEVVYIASPHRLHAGQAIAAARAGKHVLVEKPMAVSLEEARAMTDAARTAGVRMLVGHSHSYDAPILAARRLIASGAFGRLRMISALNYTDFLYRPRRPDELDTRQAGGVVFNQAPHQIDIVRCLGGGRLASVRAQVGQWDPERATEGAYAAFLAFEDGAFATLAYSGYAHFDSDEFTDWIGESGNRKDPAAYGAARRSLTRAVAEEPEERAKAERLYGGPLYAETALSRDGHQHFGLIVASCDKADLRPTPTGVLIFGDEARRFEPCPGPDIPRREVVDELIAAVREGAAPAHDGVWGLATLEACLGLLRSAREDREVRLLEQCAFRDNDEN